MDEGIITHSRELSNWSKMARRENSTEAVQTWKLIKSLFNMERTEKWGLAIGAPVSSWGDGRIKRSLPHILSNSDGYRLKTRFKPFYANLYLWRNELRTNVVFKIQSKLLGDSNIKRQRDLDELY